MLYRSDCTFGVPFFFLYSIGAAITLSIYEGLDKVRGERHVEKSVIIGTSNAYLDIDLTRRTARKFTVSSDELSRFIGGKGLGLKLIYERMDLSADPLSEGNIIAFMLGVLLGTGAPCSGRWAVVTKSPLTGIMCSASCGGPFGMALKTAGYDGLLISGCSEAPTCLEIDPEGAVFFEADGLWGKTTRETQQALSLGSGDGACVIGPAGENKVLYANIASGSRFVGRGGVGAVMGAKKLKAIVARGKAYAIRPSDEQTFKRVKERASKYINRNRITATGYRKYGTNYNLSLCNKGGVLPVNNFRLRTSAQAELVSGEVMAERFKTQYSTCKPCLILCGHTGTYADGEEHHIPEYETNGLFGPNLGIYDPEAIRMWNDMCNSFGMDTVSAAGTIAYVMEAGEKGLLETKLKFGHTAGIAEALRDIAGRKGFGNEMADGSRRLAQKYGGSQFAMQVKGLELPAYDPRGSWGQGLNYAVANRGGCHLSSYPVAMEVFFTFLNPYTARSKHVWVRFFEDLYAAVNCLHTCQFTAYAYLLEPPLVRFSPKPIISFFMQYLPSIAILMLDWSVFSGFFASVTGLRMPMRSFLKAGRRAHVLERYMNTCMGIRRKDDTLPERFLKEDESDYKRKATVPLETMLDKYYRLRGYDRNGIPRYSLLRKLGIRDERCALGNSYFKPGKKRLKRLYLGILFFFVKRGFMAASHIDSTVNREFRELPQDFSFMMKVAPYGPEFILKRDEAGHLRDAAELLTEKEAAVAIVFKNMERALKVFTFTLNPFQSYAQNGLIVKGELPHTMAVIRCLSLVEAYLLPKGIVMRILKRYPKWEAAEKHMNRLRIYARALFPH